MKPCHNQSVFTLNHLSAWAIILPKSHIFLDNITWFDIFIYFLYLLHILEAPFHSITSEMSLKKQKKHRCWKLDSSLTLKVVQCSLPKASITQASQQCCRRYLCTTFHRDIFKTGQCLYPSCTSARYFQNIWKKWVVSGPCLGLLVAPHLGLVLGWGF